MAEISRTVVGYQGATYGELIRGRRLPSKTAAPKGLLPLSPEPAANGASGFVLLTGRDLYTDREAAALRLPDADRLHRSETLEIHPRDAAAVGLGDGQPATVASNGATLTLPARVTEDVPEGVVFVAALVDAGAVQGLLDGNGSRVEVRPG